MYSPLKKKLKIFACTMFEKQYFPGGGGGGMVFGGSRSLNRVSFSPMLAQCPGVILR